MLRDRQAGAFEPPLGRLGRFLPGWWRERHRRSSGIRSVVELEDFLRAEALLIAQKSLVGYCLVKTRLPLHELTREAVFASAFERARHASFAAVLADLAVVVEGRLRAASSSRPALAAGLSHLYGAILARELGSGEETSAAESLHSRLLRVQLADPQPIVAVSRVSGEALFDSLPIHQRLREPDRESVVAGVQFLAVSRLQRLEQRLDAPALARELEESLPRIEGAAGEA